MKRIPIGVAVIVAVLLVLFGVVIGNVRGLTDDRKKVEALYSQEGGLNELLFDRGADGINLCKVAKRHLPQDDESVLTLKRCSEILMKDEAALKQKKQASDELELAFEAVKNKVSETETCKTSQRDRNYLEMLHADLTSLPVEEAAEYYNRAAEKFNLQLRKPLEGYLAGLFQIRTCVLFE